MVASLKLQKFVSLICSFILMKKRIPSSPSLSSIIHFSQHVLPPFHLSYNPSSAETQTHDSWFARPVSSPLHHSSFLGIIAESESDNFLTSYKSKLKRFLLIVVTLVTLASKFCRDWPQVLQISNCHSKINRNNEK